MSDKLDEICAKKREEVAARAAARPFAAIDAAARRAPPPRGFTDALKEKINQGASGLIAEIKKASPSAGVIRPDFSPAQLAAAYEEGSAACLSVLTDQTYFQGSIEDLSAARAASSIPVLRKDFMLDVWQVAEARAMDADCILIIMAAVDDATAASLHKAATGYGMDVLIEAHDKPELDRALRLPSGLIGINNRDLKTLKTDLATTETLAPLVPKNRIVVSESGIATPADIKRMQACGVNCFLVGEALLKQKDVAAATQTLIG